MNAPVKPAQIEGAQSVPSPLQALIGLEGEILGAPTRAELRHVVLNRTRALLDFGHAVWIAPSGKPVAICSQSDLPAHTPFGRWLRKAVRGAVPGAFTLTGRDYPFPHAYLAPMRRGSLLFTRDRAFTDVDGQLIDRLAKLAGASHTSLSRRRAVTPRRRAVTGGAAALLALALCIPVPMTVLAPADVVAADPFIVTAPMDGVISDVLIDPNAPVDAGQPLIRLDATQYGNELALAERDEAVALSRLRRADLSAFIDPEAKAEIAVARTEAALARARQDYARDRLGLTELRAPRAGLALFDDPTRLEGRPVATGEAILELADPAHTEIALHAPLDAGDVLVDGARVRLYLDADPVRPIAATLVRAGFYPAEQPGGTLAFEAVAETDTSLRIGARGVAKIYGEPAPLGLWLARRPIVAVRQFIGL